MHPLLLKCRRTTILLFAAAYIFSASTSLTFFFYLSAVLLILVVVQILPQVNPANRNISSVLIILGATLLLYHHVSFRQWLTAIGSNSGLVTLFIFLPFLSFPLNYENYEDDLKGVSHKYIHDPVRLGLVSSLLNLFLSSLLNLGALPIVMNLLKSSAQTLKAEQTLYLSLVRTNMAAVLWSPNYIAIAFVVGQLGLRWIDILPLGFFLSLLILFVHIINIKVRVKLRKEKNLTELIPAEGNYSKSRLRRLALTFLGLMLSVALLNIFTTWNILLIIPAVAIFYPLGLAILQHKMAHYRSGMQRYWTFSLLSIGNEVLLFAAAGFFGKSLEISGVGSMVTELLPLLNLHHPVILILVIITATTVLALVGIHPIVTTTALVATVKVEALGISLFTFAFTLLASYCLACLVSPFSATALTISGLTKQNPWNLSFRANILFAGLMAFIYALLIPLLT